MRGVKLDQETLGLSSHLEKLTRARIKDCFSEDDLIIIVVAPGQMGRALGKAGINIKRIQNQLGKTIRLVEYNESLEKFIRNFVHPLRPQEVSIDEDCVIIRDINKKTKSLLIGRDGKNLSLLKRAVRRFFSVDIKIE